MMTWDVAGGKERRESQANVPQIVAIDVSEYAIHEVAA
jgi:hypothetical protein